MKGFLLLFCLCLPCLHFSQVYNFKQFSVEDGLAQSQILSICQSKRGEIIFGTNGGGVSIFDGLKFSNLTENDGLLNNVVYSVKELKNGSLAFGTNAGLSIYKNNKFEQFGEKQGAKWQRIFDVFEDSAEKIWLGTESGVFIYDPRTKKAEPFLLDSVLSISSVFKIFKDSKKNWWFSTINAGVVKISFDKKTTYYNNSNGLLDNFIRSVGEDSEGNIYICANTGIHKIIDNKPVLMNLPQADLAGFTGIIPVSKNVFWITSYNGLFKCEKGKISLISVKNGLVSNALWCGIKDSEGNIWVGTEGFGAAKFMGEYQCGFLFKQDKLGENVSSLFEDKIGNIWAAIVNGGVYRMALNGDIKNYSLNPKELNKSLADNTVNAIAQDKNGVLWFGTTSGLSSFDGTSFTNFAGAAGLMDSSIFSLLFDKKGVLWIGTSNGLYCMANGKISEGRVVNKLRGQDNLAIHNIFEDSKSVLWLGTDIGVIKFTNLTAERIDKSKGFIDKRVYTIREDFKKNLFMTTEIGLFFYDHKKFVEVLVGVQKTRRAIYSLLIDKQDNLWMGTSKGIDKFNLRAYYEGRNIEINSFGRVDGLQGIECNANSALIDSKKRMWFGTIKGAAVFNSEYETKNEQEPILNITEMKLFFQPYKFSSYAKGIDSATGLSIGLELPYDKNHITFNFIGVCQTNPNKVMYRFKLDGLDEEWFEPTSKNEITYSSLLPGNYTFFLKAKNNDGVWSKEPLTYSFIILPPWYQTWWFYFLVILISLSCIYGYTTYSTHQLENQKRVLEQQVDERTHQLRKAKEKVEHINEEVLLQKTIIEAKNKDITDSINYAKNIQEALMPSINILNSSFKDSFLLYLPKDIVSGDFYWFAERGNKKFFAAVDCTGHGVPGAFMSIIGNAVLHEIIAEKKIFQPSKILNELHIGVKEALNANNQVQERRDGMDIALCAYNEESGILEYSGANRALWIFRKDKPEKPFETIKPNKFAIGGLELESKREFSHHEIQINKGDCVYVFTDGYADQFGGERGKKFMVGSLQKAIEQVYQKPMQEQRNFLQNEFLNWRGEHDQIDDVLVIGVKF